MKLHTTIAAVLLAAGIAAAQDPWEYRTSAGEYAFAQGDLERAETEFRGALELAQKLPPGDRRLEVSLENLGRLYEHEMRHEEAQPLYQLLLAAQEERVGEEDTALLDTLVAVARVSIGIGDSPSAEASLRRYLEIANASGAADPGQHWRVLSMLARMQTLAENHGDALQLERRAVQVLADDAAATDLERATELESLAQMELSHGDGAEAERLLTEAVELRIADGEGAAELLAGAASTAFGSGEPEVAERLAERALAAAHEEGTSTYRAQKVLADVAWLKLRRGGELEDVVGTGEGDPALAAARQRLADLSKLQDPVSPDTLARLARIDALAGDTADAAAWQRRYVEAMASAGGDTSKARSDLVTLLALSGSDREAADENARLIAQLESVHGPDSRKLIPALQLQQELLTRLKEKKAAKAVKKRIRKLSK
jgi:tetratricopeptide (TPR) repeat protein